MSARRVERIIESPRRKSESASKTATVSKPDLPRRMSLFTSNIIKATKTKSLCTLAALMLGLALSGCGSDSPTDPNANTPGDPNSQEFRAVNDVLGGEVLSFEGLHWHSLLEGEIPGAVSSRRRAATPAHDTVLSVTVTVDSATAWIVLQARVADHEDTANVLDSVRFYRNGTPTLPSTDLPADSMSAVDVYIVGQVSANDSTHFVGGAGHASRIHLAVLDRDPGLATVTYQLNLAAQDSLDGTAWDSVWGVCDVKVVSHKSVTNLIEVEELSPDTVAVHEGPRSIWEAVSAHEGCPLAGTVVLDMHVELNCTGGEAEVSVDKQWKVEAEFLGGDQVSVTFTSGGFYWNKTVDCSALEEL